MVLQKPMGLAKCLPNFMGLAISFFSSYEGLAVSIFSRLRKLGSTNLFIFYIILNDI